MAETIQRPPFTENTFFAYSKEQGESYATGRPDYHPEFYQNIINDHVSTGGQFDTLVDLGCGPGNVARALSSHFTHVYGLDPSEGMIATARSKGGVTSTSEPIRFEISTAEAIGTNLSPPVRDGSVDLITAGNAAHWFNMPQFWRTAARILKPGGNVMLWTSGPSKLHSSVPNAAAIDKTMDDLEAEYLKPYLAEGNMLTRGRYKDLPLPWTITPPQGDFDEKDFVRKQWKISEHAVDLPRIDLDTMEKIIETMSPVTRWREAHPETIGTEQDVVKIHRRAIERLLHEAGVEPGKEILTGTPNVVVLIVKKRSS